MGGTICPTYWCVSVVAGVLVALPWTRRQLGRTAAAPWDSDQEEAGSGMMWSLVLTVCLLCLGCDGVKVSCKDYNGGDVDWYILYKSPKTGGLDGRKFIYIDSKEVKQLPDISDSKSVLGHTLKPVLKTIATMEPDFGFISYSDQPPGCSASDTFGHSKGVLMVNQKETGVWLSHSTPQLPFRRDQNSFWPSSGDQNAQTFLCVTVNYDQFSTIGTHLQYIRAFPFDHHIPETFHQELKDAVKWEGKEPPTGHFPVLTSAGGKRFKTIAKQSSDELKDGDLYITIANEVKSGVFVQTWPTKRDESYESTFSVINVNSIKTEMGEWKTGNDHSKWCVAADPGRPWVCIADVNRATSQYTRYGGAVCVEDEKIQKLFKGFVGEREDFEDDEEKPKKRRKGI